MKILVWDLPTRLFHWLLVFGFFVAMVTGDPDRLRDLHVFAGYVVLGLLVFRILWSLLGSRYARFSSFCFTPVEAINYLRDLARGTAKRYLGHNPPGSWAIYILVVLGLLVSVSGLLVLGLEESHGVFRNLAYTPTGEAFKKLHEALSWIMLALVVFHVAGVVVESRTHHENLVLAMITGRKPGEASEGITSSHRWVGVVLTLGVAAGALWFFQGKLIESAARPYLPFIGKTLPDNETWRAECESCHLAYHPTLLPARSWQALMDKQDDHFGEALGLDTTVTAEILKFLQDNSAEMGLTEPAVKINRSISRESTPLRVTETGYWIEKHQRIADEVWRRPKVGSKANCGACHLDADKGTFEDAAMRLPK
ncbi:MAG: cytochrome b/b6 domain-containing protein [Sulfuricaulis sp.]|nr:cytochrome b/b6 domain-containing protein [Sulfuricaulis sp.]